MRILRPVRQPAASDLRPWVMCINQASFSILETQIGRTSLEDCQARPANCPEERPVPATRFNVEAGTKSATTWPQRMVQDALDALPPGSTWDQAFSGCTRRTRFTSDS